MTMTWGWLTRQSSSTMLLICVAMLCGSSIATSYFNRPVLRPAVKAAMVFHSMQIANPTIFENEPLHLHYTYDKRADCPTGHYKFTALVHDKDASKTDRAFFSLPWGTTSTEDPGIDKAAGLDVLTATVPPGSYALELIARFSCAGETTDQVISPPLRADFEVLSKLSLQ